MKKKVFIVGMGTGDPAQLTYRAVSILSRVEIILGSERQIRQLRFLLGVSSVSGVSCDPCIPSDPCFPHSPESSGITKYLSYSGRLDEMPNLLLSCVRNHSSVAVLASGDPSVYGIATYVLKCGAERPLSEEAEFEIVPGISSIQSFYAKSKLSMQDVYLTSGHGRTPDYEFLSEIPHFCMLTDKKNNPFVIASQLIANGRDPKDRMYIGSRLDEPEEEMITTSLEEMVSFLQEKGRSLSFSVVVVTKNA